ncbi:MAG: hypothetical protein LBU06_09790 [Desulfovibrio sp.]|nr:hypothetical protein [Desulfovibrio sp.]
MSNTRNPFFFQSASDLQADEVIQYYAEGGNITKALSSRENCYLIGERGAGKSMALRYHSFLVQNLLPRDERCVDTVGIYIPCNHPLMLKNEASLFDKANEIAIIEHFFTLSMAYHICSSLRDCCKLHNEKIQKKLLKNLSYSLALNKNIPFYGDIFSSIMNFSIHESAAMQKELNKINSERPKITYTFFTLILPLLDIARRTDSLEKAHFSMLFDDAHLLSMDRQKVLNSYVSYRDHSQFSFKAAIASCEDYTFMTTEGSTLVAGHDFTMLDMEEDFQNSKSDFGRFIRTIISKRFKEFNISASPDEFFPISDALNKGIEKARESARIEAIKKYGEIDSKKINDYVYKYGRARYFQNRPAKASLPQYSGIDTIAHVSTGVVRNALHPCWKMYEKELTRLRGTIPQTIPPNIQASILKEESDALWGSIRAGFGNKIEGCTKEDSKKIENFFDELKTLFRNRLLSQCSEPRILAFIVSEKESEAYEEVKRLLLLCRKAQLLYERFGPGKDDGRRETFYATNRLLWIAVGLDPEGQHGRLSIKATDILAAAIRKTPFLSASENEGQLNLLDLKDWK